MYAEPITIEKEGEVFDIFFIDSEGIMPDALDNGNQKLNER